MRCSVLALSWVLLLAAGCRHSNLPTLPASHARLSKAFERYVNGYPEAAEDIVPHASDAPQVVVEPAQARSVFEEAVQVLRGKPSAEEVRQASEDLGAACVAGLQESCTFQREQFGSPRNITRGPPEYTNEAMAKRTFATVVVDCRLGVDGRLRSCKVLESGPHGLTESVLAYTTRANFQPATLAGHPIEIPYIFTINFNPSREELTLGQRLQWARARTARFPDSPPAWATLASLLARHAPEDPGLADALRALDKAAPKYWWPANELAWLQVQARRHDEAAPLAKRARASAPNNPYVLETSAAVLAATGQCEQALQDQRQAVAKLPAEWPAPERERFMRTLEEYQRKCPQADAPAPVPEQPQPRT